MPSAAEGLTCDICNVYCGQQRAFKAHLRTNEHAKKAGTPLPEQFPCPQCERGFTRKAGVERHLRHGQCPGAVIPPVPPVPAISPSRKRSVTSELNDQPAKQIRTGSAPRDRTPPPTFDDAGQRDSVPPVPKVPEQLSFRVMEMSSYGKVTDVTSTLDSPPDLPTLLPEHDAEPDAEHGAEHDTRHDAERDEAPSHAAPPTPPPTVDGSILDAIKAASQTNLATSLQIPDDMPTMTTTESQEATDSVMPLSDAMKRVSLEVNSGNSSADLARDGRLSAQLKRPRSSAGASMLSTNSKHSIASLGSIGSLFLNRSPRSSVAGGSLHRSSSSSARSIGERTTMSEDMPAPMLEPIDEELHFARKEKSFWDKYKLKRGPQKLFGWAPHPAYLWDYTAQGNVEGVRRTLSFGKVEVNSPDQYGWTALLTASSHGHAEIVELLLQRKDIDVEYQDAQGSTALSWAASNGHLEVVRLLLASGKIKHAEENGSGAAALTWATMKGHSEIVSLLMETLYPDGATAEEKTQDERQNCTLHEDSRWRIYGEGVD